MFCGLEFQIFGGWKETDFIFLAYNSLLILKSYDIVLLTLKTSPNIVGDVGHVGIYKFQ